ncbi:hypothetical protein AC844P1_00034 [Anaerostipes phage AC844P1]|nr:hypothetical protein AC844P1_00034 [Anaerostipes phage AC844P1]WAX05304.1 hypothetical protein AC844P2_00034 [Anaerostipes phage AC844P2]WAX05363.1 hypothetical protein AC844P3_00034 [Anaerostipes phage AC844P3]
MSIHKKTVSFSGACYGNIDSYYLIIRLYHISVVNTINNIRKGGVKLYEKFAKLLEKNNKTAYRVSKDTGIAQSVLSDWKRGISNPKVDKLKKLSDYFGVPLEYFLEEETTNQ